MNIKDFRKTYNLSQNELAKLLNIPQSTLSYIESGKTKKSKHNKKINEHLSKYEQCCVVKEKKENWISKVLKFIGVRNA